MMMALAEEKNKIRIKLLQKMHSVITEEIERRSQHVKENIKKLSIYKNANSIMVYYPLKGEVDLLGMIRKDLEFKVKRVAFPVIKQGELVPYCIKDLEKDFCRGSLGIKEPDTTKTSPLPIDELDLVLVPGLAFDRTRNRLGRGKGFYDRFLKRCPAKTKKVGVAFEFQILENLPVSIPNDEKLDLVVSENSCI
jgi:5-formyltetrahydrofolate cyclo-ligase